MAFKDNNATPIGGNARAGENLQGKNAPMGWAYLSETDSLDDVETVGYFDTFTPHLVAGQFIYVSLSDGKFIVTIKTVDKFLKQVTLDELVFEPGTVTKQNSTGILYIKGDAVTDKSQRFIIDPEDNIAEIQLRTGGAGGVWDNTSFRISSDSLMIGRDMTLSSAGSFLEIFSISSPVGHQRSLIPHSEFNEAGSQGNHVPLVDILKNFSLFTTPTSQIISTAIGQVINIQQALLLDRGFFLTGTIPAADPVRLSFYLGTDNNSSPFFIMNYVAADFPANTLVDLDFNDDFGIENDEDIFLEFTSDSNFSLQVDASANIIMSFDAHEMKEADIIIDNWTLANDLSLTFSNELELTVGNNF